MTKGEFLNRLAYALSALPQQERDKVLAYYSELIDDKIESGKTEQEVIFEFGDINVLAQNILIENNIYINKPKSNKTYLKPLIIVLLILFSPAIFGIFMGLFGVAIGLACALFAIIFAIFITSVAFALSGIACFFSSFIIIPTSPAYGILQMGCGLFLAGASLFLFMGTYYLTKAILKLVKLIYNSIRNAFSKRRVTQ